MTLLWTAKRACKIVVGEEARARLEQKRWKLWSSHAFSPSSGRALDSSRYRNLAACMMDRTARPAGNTGITRRTTIDLHFNFYRTTLQQDRLMISHSGLSLDIHVWKQKKSGGWHARWILLDNQQKIRPKPVDVSQNNDMQARTKCC